VSDARADLLIVNARVWTDGARVGHANAIAVRGRELAAVGDRAALESFAGPRTRVIDARGATVTPGICDAHLHLLPWARARAEVALAGARERDEALARVRAWAAQRPGTRPLMGRGWDANDWREPPERGALDAIADDRPVLLHSHDFHALWVNSAALREAGVTRATRDPQGGLIERDAAGEPTGVLRENAVMLMQALEERGAREAGGEPELLAAAAQALHAQGVTSVHDFERGEKAWRTMESFARGAGARVRVVQCVGYEDLERVIALGLSTGDGDDTFRIGSLKMFADGTLGSRTAALLAPYDGTDERGIDILEAAELMHRVANALDRGISVAIHAIGDRACRHALDAFERAGDRRRRARGPCRIEHAQLVSPADLPRFAALGVTASMQPQHCTSDIDLAERFWGTRREACYAWRSFLDCGTALAFGSDAPVEPPSAADGLAAACTRQRADGMPEGGFVPAQRLTLDQALAAYTEAGARLGMGWPRVGSLRAGSLADVVIWDRDLHATAPSRLHQVRPSCTVWDGAVVFEADEAGA
jgi:predicted amidohydrolase YtcJ